MAWDELPEASNTKTSATEKNQPLVVAVCARGPGRAEPTPAGEALMCHLSVPYGQRRSGKRVENGLKRGKNRSEEISSKLSKLV